MKGPPKDEQHERYEQYERYEQFNAIVAYLFGGVEERLHSIAAGLPHTSAQELAAALGGLLLQMGHGAEGALPGVSEFPAEETGVRQPKVAMAERASRRPQQAKQRSKDKRKRLVACPIPGCGRKTRGVWLHMLRAHGSKEARKYGRKLNKS